MATASPQDRTIKLPDGYTLHYSLFGEDNKPLLLLIIGSTGIGGLFRRLALHLQSNFTCVIYTRRGFVSGSIAPPTSTQRAPAASYIAQQAADAAALIEHLSDPSQKESAYVFGNSFGAVIAMELLVTYPQLLHTVMVHEPMFPNLLPEAQRRETAVKIQEIVSAPDVFGGFADYFLRNMDDIKDVADSESVAQDAEALATYWKSQKFWTTVDRNNLAQFRMEFTLLIEHPPCSEALMSLSDKIVLMCGIDSMRMRLHPFSAALQKTLAQAFLWKMAGGHTSFANQDHAADFCAQLVFVLIQRDRLRVGKGMTFQLPAKL